MVRCEPRKVRAGRSERKAGASRRAVQVGVERRQSVTPSPQGDAQSLATSPHHQNEADDCEALMKALGTTDRDIAGGLLLQRFHAGVA